MQYKKCSIKKEYDLQDLQGFVKNPFKNDWLK